MLTTSTDCLVVSWVVVLALSLLLDAPARSQSNLDAGKSPEQIFSDTCSACHHAPQDLKQTSAQFLRQHYTTGARQAAAMAAYLERAINELPATPVVPVQPFRRPSESVEMQLPASGSAGAPSEASRAAAATRHADGFEE